MKTLEIFNRSREFFLASDVTVSGIQPPHHRASSTIKFNGGTNTLKRLSRISVLLLAIATMAAGPVLADTYTIDASHSNVGFSIRHLVSKTKGTFASFGGTIAYDAAHPDKSTFNGSIDVASIDTQNERRDGHLQSADFFDVAQYPTITFVSTKVETKSDSLLHVTGDLMIHGVTKAVTIPVEIIGSGTHPNNGKKQIGLAGEITVKASDFGVNSWKNFDAILGDDVKIEIVVEAGAA
jgi:polyisoprenoid-binding protein YceI